MHALTLMSIHSCMQLHFYERRYLSALRDYYFGECMQDDAALMLIRILTLTRDVISSDSSN